MGRTTRFPQTARSLPTPIGLVRLVFAAVAASALPCAMADAPALSSINPGTNVSPAEVGVRVEGDESVRPIAVGHDEAPKACRGIHTAASGALIDPISRCWLGMAASRPGCRFQTVRRLNDALHPVGSRKVASCGPPRRCLRQDGPALLHSGLCAEGGAARDVPGGSLPSPPSCCRAPSITRRSVWWREPQQE